MAENISLHLSSSLTRCYTNKFGFLHPILF